MDNFNYFVNHDKKMLYQFGNIAKKVLEDPNNNTYVVDDLISHYDHVSLFEYPRILGDLSKIQPVDEILTESEILVGGNVKNYKVIGSIFLGVNVPFGNTTIRR
jgi:hypothetical protein